MRVRKLLFTVGACAGAAILALTGIACAQAPAPEGGAAAPAQTASVHGNLVQVMRGILFPASNVIFASQSTDPATVKPEADPATSPNPLSSSYGGWEAVANAGIALAESANLLTVPGRQCQNGKPVPVQNADWQMWVQGLRDAGMTAYKAGQAKSQDAVLEAADAMATACQNCHDKYREVPGGVADRC
ncbi:MAG: hypothetical protein HW394_1350 [Acidobacteria bacterium]|nr:hypothetical protein [Acidobacteriota bacterium]